MRGSWLCVIVGFGLWTSALRAQETKSLPPDRLAEVLVIDAHIHTVDPEKPFATSMAIQGDRILAVGTRDELQPLVGPQTKLWSAGGRWITPGFIEGHGHFLGLGQSLQMLDLSSAKSWDDIIAQVQTAASQAEPGQWIVGRGWHQEKWTTPPTDHVDGYPRHQLLSEVSPQNPVLLTHASGHASFANDYAMKLAGVSAETPNPPGGELLKAVDPTTGEVQATGVFRETASALVQRVYDQAQQRMRPEAKREQWLDAVQRASRACLENGITTFQDAGSSIRTIDELQALSRQDQLPVRLWIMARDSNEQLERHLARVRIESQDSPFLAVRAIKCSIDGALGPHGAWLISPYEDLSSSVGLNTTTIASIEETARLAIRKNYQLCVHAIGDRANREVLDLYQRIFEETLEESSNGAADWRSKAKSLRWRIEHAQHLAPSDIPRFAELGVIPAMQGIHCPSDAVYVLQRLGYRRAAEGAYVWRSLIDSGAIIVNGTDAPVERISPLASFYASVARRMPGGPEFFPEQAMTRLEALQSYTLWAAQGAFEEDVKGSLTPGKYADFTIWSQDLLNCPVEQIPATTVLGTVVGGRIAFEAPGYKLDATDTETDKLERPPIQ
ncbi:MAG: amidohydrolase [Pirellulaceae bacterium]|nr:amidohydrolase [Pirellulaceae bacterium]